MHDKDYKTIAEQNISLLYAFSCNPKYRIPHTTVDELFSLLALAYLGAIKTFLRKQPEEQLSTYVYKTLKWELVAIKTCRTTRHMRLVHVPRTNEEHLACFVRQGINIVNFNGKEALCDDKALLHHDDLLASFVTANNKQTIEVLLNSLTPRDRLIIRLAFGLETGKALGVSAIGRIIKRSPERVRQLKYKALQKLKERAMIFTLKKLIFPEDYLIGETANGQ